MSQALFYFLQSALGGGWGGGGQRMMGLKVQPLRGILYHDMPKLLGRRMEGLQGRKEGDKDDTGWLDRRRGGDAYSLSSSSSSALLGEGKEEI